MLNIHVKITTLLIIWHIKIEHQTIYFHWVKLSSQQWNFCVNVYKWEKKNGDSSASNFAVVLLVCIVDLFIPCLRQEFNVLSLYNIAFDRDIKSKS